MGVPSEDFKLFTYLPPSTFSPVSATTPITLNNNSTWTHCGPLLDLASLPPSFHIWACATLNGNLLPHLIPFLSFVHAFLIEAQLDNYWLTIRATRATHDFDIPRWHTDRPFLDRAGAEASKGEGEVAWKLATTLLGPGTLFLPSGAKARRVQKQVRQAVRKSKEASHNCSVIRCLGCAGMQENVRERLAFELRNYRVVQAAPGECAFFRVGDANGAVHSEPESQTDRIFVNVVPGQEEVLRRLAGRWGMEFPRAWSMGV